jgi:hypothetical protein
MTRVYSLLKVSVILGADHEQLFSQSGQAINIQFKKQLKQTSMLELIKDIIQSK